jgi:hypothetical protein
VRVDDDIDALYAVSPDQFTATRKELAAAAKKRGDAEGAKRIAASRRPTVAAWVVNVLVRADGTARTRLGDLSERLRTAHASMDGTRIRELSREQRALVDQLVRTAFAAAELTQPSAALRDDVVGTLQAAVADPDVAARLGRLERAERWAGFGEFGTVTAVGVASKAGPKSTMSPKPPQGDPESGEGDADSALPVADLAADLAAAREHWSAAAATAEAARVAHSDAVALAAAGAAKLATARRRYEKLLESIDAAERAMNEADQQSTAADDAVTVAANQLSAADSDLDSANAELARLGTTSSRP